MSESSARALRTAVVFVLLAVAMNGLIFWLGWNRDGATRVDIAPPGWVVGGVWVVLLALLGIAHARISASRPARGSVAAGASGYPIARRMIVVLLLLCLAYPLYTGGLANDVAAMIGNFVVMAWAVATLIVVSALDRGAGALIAPLILWIGYANAIVGAALA